MKDEKKYVFEEGVSAEKVIPPSEKDIVRPKQSENEIALKILLGEEK